ncbi:hypothetical protein E2C01_040477 [Portunus trituberculatus]|uniref:Uncharacterized protein n=1 Tax=Portunus trituberculatus TaxID=210409 RepID=A0A5B7FGT0_PORTR|nr:hypothetical protein [Portunus trituberculatus]
MQDANVFTRHKHLLSFPLSGVQFEIASGAQFENSKMEWSKAWIYLYDYSTLDSIIMVIAKVWQLVRRPEGEPTVEDFLCVEEELPACSEGGRKLCFLWLVMEVALCGMVKAAWRQEMVWQSVACLDASWGKNDAD